MHASVTECIACIRCTILFIKRGFLLHIMLYVNAVESAFFYLFEKNLILLMTILSSHNPLYTKRFIPL